MQQRNYERIAANLALRFPCHNTFYPGTAVDISQGGLFINTELCFPVKSRMEVLIKLRNEILKVPVEIVRTAKSDHRCQGMGVRILNISRKYLELFSKLSFRQ
jgi:Tfp pilus assembly protein PilZ